MILTISRGHIKVSLLDRDVTVQGEMFFPGDDKIGFVVYSDTIKCWDPPLQAVGITEGEKQLILEDIEHEFEKGGHELDIE